MKKCFRLVLLAVLIIGVSAPAFAAGGSLKIGYVDANAVAIQSQWGKKLAEDIKKESDRMAAELDEKGKVVKSAFDEFDKHKDVMDTKARDKKQKELQEMYTEAQKQASESSAKLNQMRSQMTKPLFEKILEIARKIGRDDKYDFILDKNAVLFSASDKDDLTKRLVTDVDKESPK